MRGLVLCAGVVLLSLLVTPGELTLNREDQWFERDDAVTPTSEERPRHRFVEITGDGDDDGAETEEEKEANRKNYAKELNQKKVKLWQVDQQALRFTGGKDEKDFEKFAYDQTNGKPSSGKGDGSEELIQGGTRNCAQILVNCQMKVHGAHRRLLSTEHHVTPLPNDSDEWREQPHVQERMDITLIDADPEPADQKPSSGDPDDHDGPSDDDDDDTPKEHETSDIEGEKNIKDAAETKAKKKAAESSTKANADEKSEKSDPSSAYNASKHMNDPEIKAAEAHGMQQGLKLEKAAKEVITKNKVDKKKREADESGITAMKVARSKPDKYEQKNEAELGKEMKNLKHSENYAKLMKSMKLPNMTKEIAAAKANVSNTSNSTGGEEAGSTSSGGISKDSKAGNAEAAKEKTPVQTEKDKKEDIEIQELQEKAKEQAVKIREHNVPTNEIDIQETARVRMESQAQVQMCVAEQSRGQC